MGGILTNLVFEVIQVHVFLSGPMWSLCKSQTPQLKPTQEAIRGKKFSETLLPKDSPLDMCFVFVSIGKHLRF